ncbi:isoquinoline 1-oxidoreductase beta subunit [Sphingomonas jinjuensis]|uniref:Isoquinoline 1-oxidoreductase beta subunit n=1 Tax=Sphingomonas jinjuensis TaxID=535907 RepID=A0A840F013_9SPHN|nr:molybdopterin cofactor-binding domain-containing protein [Sphingomonas jinjuensis]MBB4152603.1 isoquinoline 1-oxidoreductase beta subunit [Sphingomonas jinjuensis]
MPVTRRNILIGGGAGIGLIAAWALWPRTYTPRLTLNPGETAFGAWLKIGIDGHVTVVVPQCEHGQGVYTALPQIVADELGADWRTVGVEPAPIGPFYANPLALDELFEGNFDRLPAGVRDTLAKRSALMLTGAATSVRQFEAPLREAAAAARALLCQAAAQRWGIDWNQTRTEAGFVVAGNRSLRFAELAAEATGFPVPDPLPIGTQGAGKLAGQSVPRLDTPAKVDGSANFAGDVRLPDMVHAAIRQAPPGDSRLIRVDTAAADRVRGAIAVVQNPRWVAAVATTWWAATRALDAAAPRFETRGLIDSASIDRALAAAFAQPGHRVAAVGDVDAAMTSGRTIAADYTAAAAVHAAIETMSAVAAWRDDRLELWMPTQAPSLARAAAAAAAGVSEASVVIHPMLAGGSFGANLEALAAEQAAILALRLKRPVSLVWPRAEDLVHDRVRPPARARMAARLAGNGAILGWHARIAAPATGAELAHRLMPGAVTDLALAGRRGDPYAVAGAAPPYRLPAMAVDHHPADIGLPTGHLRGGAHGYTAFFTECFLDEIARASGSEPMSFRIGMLGGNPRLARCLTTAAALGGWDGGTSGGGQGIAAHAFRGSFIAVLAEAHLDDDGRPAVDRLVAAVDAGRLVNPDLARQQIESGLIFGMAMALGGATGYTRNLADARGFASLALPRLADTPDINVEFVPSDEDSGGIGDLGVPAVAPAIANAIHAATGQRLRGLPLRAS